jgi:hypothetical protein
VHPLVEVHDADWPGVHPPAEDPELPQPARRAKLARIPAVTTLVHFFIERSSLIRRRAGTARSYRNRDPMGTLREHAVKTNRAGEFLEVVSEVANTAASV